MEWTIAGLALALCVLLGHVLGRVSAGRSGPAIRELTEQVAERDRTIESLRRHVAELRHDLEAARRPVISWPAAELPEVPDGPEGQTWPDAA
jgi:hypothetical protein